MSRDVKELTEFMAKPYAYPIPNGGKKCYYAHDTGVHPPRLETQDARFPLNAQHKLHTRKEKGDVIWSETTHNVFSADTTCNGVFCLPPLNHGKEYMKPVWDSFRKLYADLHLSNGGKGVIQTSIAEVANGGLHPVYFDIDLLLYNRKFTSDSAEALIIEVISKHIHDFFPSVENLCLVVAKKNQSIGQHLKSPREWMVDKNHVKDESIYEYPDDEELRKLFQHRTGLKWCEVSSYHCRAQEAWSLATVTLSGKDNTLAPATLMLDAFIQQLEQGITEFEPHEMHEYLQNSFEELDFASTSYFVTNGTRYWITCEECKFSRTQQFSLPHVELLRECLHNTIFAHTVVELTDGTFVKPLHGVWKHGFHIHAPDVFVSGRCQDGKAGYDDKGVERVYSQDKWIREHVTNGLDEKNAEWPSILGTFTEPINWKKIIDVSVFHPSNTAGSLRMLFSGKKPSDEKKRRRHIKTVDVRDFYEISGVYINGTLDEEATAAIKPPYNRKRDKIVKALELTSLRRVGPLTEFCTQFARCPRCPNDETNNCGTQEEMKRGSNKRPRTTTEMIHGSNYRELTLTADDQRLLRELLVTHHHNYANAFVHVVTYRHANDKNNNYMFLVSLKGSGAKFCLHKGDNHTNNRVFMKITMNGSKNMYSVMKCHSKKCPVGKKKCCSSFQSEPRRLHPNLALRLRQLHNREKVETNAAASSSSSVNSLLKQTQWSG